MSDTSTSRLTHILTLLLTLFKAYFIPPDSAKAHTLLLADPFAFLASL